METRLNSTTVSSTVSNMLRDKYAHSDNFIEKLINDTKSRRTEASRVLNNNNLRPKEAKKRGE